MNFTLRPGLICFSDDRPGNHATMFGPDGSKLPFRGDASSFSDALKAYTWAFEWSGVPDGQQFVFATSDREVAGVAKDANVGIVPVVVRVERIDGKPMWIAAPVPIVQRPVSGLRSSKLVALGGSLSPAPSSASARCMFVNPVIPYNQWGCYKAGVMNEASFSAHGSAYVSAALKNQGHTTFLVDFRSMSGWGHVQEVLRVQEYDVAFVGCLSIDVFHAAAAVRLLKELHPDRPVVVGGLHVSIAKERIFPRPDLVEYYTWGNEDLLPGSFKEFLAFKGESRYIPERYPLADYVILDDGEIAAQNLVAELAAGRRPAERTIDGGAVPMEIARHMDRDLFRLDFEAYSPILPFQPTPMATVTWARGCPFHCRYCNLASQLSNTNVREKPVELVEEELDDLHRRFGGRISSLMLHDDLTFHPKHISQWCELILRKYGPIPLWMQTRADWVVTRYRRDRPFWDLLCKAGLTWVSVGYESGSQRMLDFMGKDNTVENNIECARILDEYGINSFANLLWGCPTETRDEAEQTVKLVEIIKPGFLSGSIYCNYPGTQMDAECRDKDWLLGGQVYARSHLPWQVTVKGIDYVHKNDCVARAGSFANYLRMPKMLSTERQRDLAATSRGLPIH